MNKNIRHKIGDNVVALTDPENEECQPRKKGHVYTVFDVAYCPKCGVQEINIGPHTNSAYTLCDCGGRHDTRGLFWTHSCLFAPIDEATMQSAIEEENYELAAILRDLMIELEPIKQSEE